MINVLAHFCYVEQVNLSYLDRFPKNFMLKPETIIFRVSPNTAIVSQVVWHRAPPSRGEPIMFEKGSGNIWAD